MNNTLSEIKSEIESHVCGKMVKSVAVAENGKWWDLIFDDGILTIETLSSPKIPVLVWRTFGTPNSVNKQELVLPNE